MKKVSDGKIVILSILATVLVVMCAEFGTQFTDTVSFDAGIEEKGPITDLRAMQMADRFVNANASYSYDYGGLEEIDGVKYHYLASNSPSVQPSVFIVEETGEIFLLYGNEGLITAEEFFRRAPHRRSDHRTFCGDEEYADGYAFFHKYMSVIVDKENKKKAKSLMDTSYFKNAGIKDYEKINEKTWKKFDTLFTYIEKLQLEKAAGTLEDYELSYMIDLIDEYDDAAGDKWIDIYMCVVGYTKTKDGSYDWNRLSYRISVKQEKRDWVVVRISNV